MFGARSVAMNKFVEPRPYADREAAARKIMEIANGLGDVWEGRLFTEKVNWSMLHDFGATPAEWRTGIDRASTERGQRFWRKQAHLGKRHFLAHRPQSTRPQQKPGRRHEMMD